jgi:hypothetical protein
MYPSVLVTVPWPLVDTVRVYSGANVAATDWFCVMVRLQGPLPVQAPLQPLKPQPGAGEALSVTGVLER